MHSFLKFNLHKDKYLKDVYKPFAFNKKFTFFKADVSNLTVQNS